MAVTHEDMCVGCPPHMGCLGSSCPNRNVQIFSCDECKDELKPEELYMYDDKMLCEYCLLLNFETVAQFIERGGEL